MKPATKQGL